jgi:sulfite oxidase
VNGLPEDTGQVEPGDHTLRRRAVDGTGAIQDATVAPPAPNGASGYHQVSVVTR